MLEIKNLGISIEGKEIVKSISLTVKPGEVHAIMGPNGSGKSTLANALAGHPAYAVSVGNQKSNIKNQNVIQNAKRTYKEGIFLNGESLLMMSPDERAREGLFLAFQYPVEIAGVRVNKFLRYAYEARFGDDPAHKFNTVLAFNEHLEGLAEELKVNQDLLKRGLNEGFSGGEKKRLEILQMALLEPKYAVLDETDSGLDIDAVKTVAEGVNKVVEKYGTGVLVITHYQRILKYLKPDFVHVMVGGKIVESGDREVAERLEISGYQRLASRN